MCGPLCSSCHVPPALDGGGDADGSSCDDHGAGVMEVVTVTVVMMILMRWWWLIFFEYFLSARPYSKQLPLMSVSWFRPEM